MNRFGNLENLNLGMGLVAKPSQYLPADSASFQGLDLEVFDYKSVAVVISIVAAIYLFIKFKK